jgi:hypothetical protein
MSETSLLFIDSVGISYLKNLLPGISISSDIVDFQKLASSSGLAIASYDAKNGCLKLLPQSSFTVHRLRSIVEEPSEQPLLVEAGFISFKNYILTERNPTNQNLPSLTPLQRRALPGLILRNWPLPQAQQAWRQIPGSWRSNHQPKLRDASCQVLSSYNNPNWYHWLTLPGLCSLPHSLNGLELLFTDRSIRPRDSAQSSLLKRVAILAAALYPGNSILFDRGPILYRHLEANFIENHTSLVCDPVNLLSLRQAALSLIPHIQAKKDYVCIYLRRGSKSPRALLEEEKLEYGLSNLGFIILDAAALPLSQCISLVAQASWIVAPHGAALTNLVFASPGTRVLELMPGSIETYGHYALMSAALSLQHNIWIGQSNNTGAFEIDQAAMFSWLSAQLELEIP